MSAKSTGRKTRRRKTREPMTDDLRCKLALERFEPLKSGERCRSYSELGEKHGKRDPAVVARAVAAAFERSLVEIRKVDTVRFPNRVSALEDQLKDKFGLKEAVVIEEEPQSDDEGEASYGDRVHKKLGLAVARFLTAGPSIFWDGEKIGLGTGRAVFETVCALASLPPKGRPKFRIGDIELLSLNGVLYPQPHAGQMGIPLDADNHISILASCFASVRLHPISYSIAHSEEEIDAIRQNTWLADDKFDNHLPTHALVGMGVLAAGHRFFEEIKQTREGVSPPTLRNLKAVDSPLPRLVEYASKIRELEPRYCPVGDVANRLFFVPPPPELRGRLPKDLEDKITPLIDKVNRLLLTISDAQLGRIRNVMLVAGTRTKALAIRKKLRDSRDKRSPGGDPEELARKPNVGFLCTDAGAAEMILGAKEPSS